MRSYAIIRQCHFQFFLEKKLKMATLINYRISPLFRIRIDDPIEIILQQIYPMVSLASIIF